MEFPVNVALARAVSTLPHGPDYWYEPKFDGHRMIMRRTEESVILYARSGRVVTSNWMDLAVAGMELRPATVLDGEAVVWRDGHLDFGAVQSRAASSVARARFLAGQHPAAYACWDVLHHPDPAIGDTRALPYTRRRELLLNLLDGIGSPIQPVPATDDRTVAEDWYESLQPMGIEGVVAKRGTAGYPSGRRAWVKVRHADTAEARVVGFTGARRRPRNLVLVLAGAARPRMSVRLDPVLAARIGTALLDAPATGQRRTHGEPYTGLETDLVVEVLAGTGRHGTLTVVRIR
ncbi:ATP-dependent DNA ligase [Streptomyces argenteolus]|uniref:ATP-dependent DNA ligase n=1 Tax=Streptomyces sp. NPDC025273 TaxID=3155251 RepID=UPI0033D8020B